MRLGINEFHTSVTKHSITIRGDLYRREIDGRIHRHLAEHMANVTEDGREYVVRYGPVEVVTDEQNIMLTFRRWVAIQLRHWYDAAPGEICASMNGDEPLTEVVTKEGKRFHRWDSHGVSGWERVE